MGDCILCLGFDCTDQIHSHRSIVGPFEDQSNRNRHKTSDTYSRYHWRGTDQIGRPSLSPGAGCGPENTLCTHQDQKESMQQCYCPHHIHTKVISRSQLFVSWHPLIVNEKIGNVNQIEMTTYLLYQQWNINFCTNYYLPQETVLFDKIDTQKH